MKEMRKNLSWNFYSWLIILSYCALQIIRWQILPQFMDIYYHLLTAWGFIQAGGYVGWDFWQYAPVGRIHIYPPVFHIILAVLMKLGLSPIILAKLFETIIPLIFMVVLWHFIRKNYNECLAFFVMLALNASFSFWLSLLNHLPATLAIIFGLLAINYIFRRRFLSSIIFLTLCFYTHIGISWFFALVFIFYALLNKEDRPISLKVLALTLLLSIPIVWKQWAGINSLSSLGLNLQEKYLSEIKIIDYLLAFLGLFFAYQADKKYRIFISFFVASFLFIIYPYRFFSSEGYIAVVLSSAFCLYSLYQRLKDAKPYLKYLPLLAALCALFFSPTLSMHKQQGLKKLSYKLNLFGSAFTGMLLAKGQNIWFPQDYMPAAALIRENSLKEEIVYSTLNITGMMLAGISGRPTANALLPEIKPTVTFDPFLSAKIVIFNRLDNQDTIKQIIRNYRLIEIGQTKIFILYRNPSCSVKAKISEASVPFWSIYSLGFSLVALLWLDNSFSKNI